LFALTEKDPIQVSHCLAKVITDHGAPEELLSDFRGEFVNAVNTALVERFSISRLRTTPGLLLLTSPFSNCLNV
jgi:hypothetical protein